MWHYLIHQNSKSNFISKLILTRIWLAAIRIYIGNSRKSYPFLNHSNALETIFSYLRKSQHRRNTVANHSIMVLILKMSPKLQTINSSCIMNQSTQQHFEMWVKEWRKYNKYSYNWNKQEKFKETTISKYNHKAKLQLPTSPPQLCHNNQHKHKNIGTKKCVLQIWYR